MFSDSAARRAPCVGLVLAGGPGVRLRQGIAKPLVSLEGRTLLERAIAIVRPICDEILVAAPAQVDLGPVDADMVRDVPGLKGPLAGIVAGLEARPGSGFVVLGVDYPLVRSELLGDLFGRLGPLTDAVVPRPKGRAQPLAAAYAPTARDTLRRAVDEGERSMFGALARLSVAWVDDPELALLPGGIESLLNVNAPEDLDRAGSLLRHDDTTHEETA